VERFGRPEGSAGRSTVPPLPRSQVSKKQFGAKPQAASRLQLSAVPVPQPQVTTSANPLGELEKVDDATLMAALTQTDRQIVTLALAGASEELMNRILRRLPRRQAKDFRKRLRDIGPTRLSDMLAAQQQLAQNARQ
jgi:CelD/BcsL family acetyltransferase involved in cellulose biosynthesis